MYEIEELDPRIRIMTMEKTDHETHLMAHLVSSTSHCPDCGARCDRRHGFTWRRIGDLFRIQHCIRLTLRVPKWFCDNPNCERIIFTERLEWAIPYSRRTNRTNHVLTTLMLAMNAKEAARVCPTIGIKISHDTLLKILRRVPVPSEQPGIIGIDDFAFKKGRRYGTIICNAQTHRPIELFRSRNPDELIAWMDRLIEKPVRASSDRFPGYQETLQKKGVTVVSDRFHLIHNLWELFVTVCRRVLPGRLPIPKKQSVVEELPSSTTDFLPIDSNRQILVSSVKAMYRKGMSLNAIARSLHLNWRTVKKYSELNDQTSLLRPKRSHSIDRYMDHLREYVMNHLTLKEIERLLRGLGYKGSYGAIRYRARDIRRGLLLENPLFFSRKDACRLLWQWPKKNEKDIADVSDLLREYPDLSIPFCFIQGFREAIRVRDSEELLRLIMNPKVMAHPRLARFVRRLKKDLLVILAACQYEENNGYVEGNVNRLKMIKRLMYGRANFDLLRIRVLCRNPDPKH